MLRSYFDHNATTPVSALALDTFVRVSRDCYGNASSIHQYGQHAKQELESARSSVAALLGCARNEIVWTSGGTEADNLAVLGAVRRFGPGSHVVTTSIEHPAVLNACRQLEREGVTVTYLPVGSSGCFDPQDLRRALLPQTRFISLMHVNSETGVIQPIEEAGQIAREAGAMLHSDGVQAAGKLPIDVTDLAVDLYSVSAHKVYAPKGTGALYISKGAEIDPLLYGGRQESGNRAGTENVAGAAAFGAAARNATEQLSHQSARIAALRDRLESAVLDCIPDVSVNGKGSRVPNTSSLCFRGIEGEALVIALDLKGYSISSGSACSSGAVEPSHVLLAMGLSRQDAKSSVRISLGMQNTQEQVDGLVEALTSSVAHLRRLSPVYANA